MKWKIFGIVIVFLAIVFFVTQSRTRREELVSPLGKSGGSSFRNVPVEPAFLPESPRLEKVFINDHQWVSTLSAEKVRLIIATGDVIPARHVNFNEVKRGDFLWPWVKVAKILKKADITLINLEAPLVSDCPATSSGMTFCGDKRNVEGLVFSGVDVANFSNNHMGNYGEKGVKETADWLMANGISPTGISGPTFKDVRGLKFGFLGYNEISDGRGAVSWAEEEKIATEVARAKKEADIVVVSFHWGVEYTHKPTERQIKLAHLAIDSGADLIIGNHPHWFQPIEIYKDKFVTYAHGNFVFDQEWSEETKEGVAGRYVFYENRLIDVEFLPVLISDYGQPSFLEDQRKEKILTTMRKESEVLRDQILSGR